MNLGALVLLMVHIFIVSYVDAGTVVLMNSNITQSFEDMEAYFSPSEEATVETGVLYVADPLDACQKLGNKPKQSTNGTFPFVLIVRGGGCSFDYKVRNAQGTGFKAAIIHDDMDRDFLISMDGEEYGINIQAVFVSKAAGETLKKYAGLAETRVMLVPSLEESGWSLFACSALVVSLGMFLVLTSCVFVYRCCASRRNNTSQFHVMSHRMVKSLPSVRFTSVRGYITTALSCAICLEDYSVGDKLRVLPCCHKFHAACVDLWLTSWRTFCPVCKRDARISTDEPSPSESTPLLRSSIAGSSLVNIYPPPLVGSSFLNTSSSQQSFRYSSQESWPSPINVSHISADFEQQAASSSRRSHITCIDSLDSPFYSNISSLNEIMLPYQTSPINASPRLVQSTSHRFNSLLCRELQGSSSHFASAHSLEEC